MDWKDNLRSVKPYVPGEQPQVTGRLIKLNTNECPYPPSPGAVEALKNMDCDLLRLYPDPEAGELKEAISEVYSIPVNRIFTGVGSDDVLSMAFMAFFNGKLPILFPDVTYSFYEVWAGLHRIPYRKIPLDNEFGMDVDDYSGECGGIVFPNPNAPTGILLDIMAVEELVRSHPECVVICDEAYIDFGGKSARFLTDKYENLLVVQTMSKSRSLAGLRVGWAFGSEKLINALTAVRDSFNSYTLNRLAIAAGAAAIRDMETMRKNVQRIVCTRERTEEKLKEMDFYMTESSANFLFCGSSRTPADELFQKLRASGIFVRHFPGERTSDRLRVTVGTDEQMDALLERIRLIG